MVLTRQGVPVLAETAAKAKDGVKKGAYVLVDTEGTPDVILMASGSEVQWAVAAAKTLPARASRLASCPCRPWNGSRSRTPSTRRPCFRPLSRLVSPSRPALPCRGTSTSLLRQARLHRAVRPAGRRRSEHDRPRHHRRARGGSRQGLHRRSRSRQVSPLPPSDEGGLYSRLHLIGLSLEGST